MAAIEDEKVFGLKIRESANDGSDFGTPDADYRFFFLGEDGEMHTKDSADAISDPFSGTLASGTGFPGGPSDNDIFYRTDLDLLFFYNGTRWLTVTLYQIGLDAGITTITSTTTVAHIRVPILAGGSDLWIEDVQTGFIVTGGTALGASHKWVGTVDKIHATTATTIATLTIDSGASDTYRDLGPTALDVLLNNGTAEFLLRTVWTKTGTPGSLTRGVGLTYRIVAT